MIKVDVGGWNKRAKVGLIPPERARGYGGIVDDHEMARKRAKVGLIPPERARGYGGMRSVPPLRKTGRGGWI